ncbi:hypothetical protein [Brevibacillus sp. SYSU BS000544]|uniref:hypothetical protein n=1 Tax=Brevibacillus sp. SYSU BS000544 TaxID=3416443 RepID=UPI003CE4BA31
MQNQKVDYHLQQAFAHLKEALNVSVAMVMDNQENKQMIGKKWETFLGEFFQLIKVKGKESKLNLLSAISFPKLWR